MVLFGSLVPYDGSPICEHVDVCPCVVCPYVCVCTCGSVCRCGAPVGVRVCTKSLTVCCVSANCAGVTGGVSP